MMLIVLIVLGWFRTASPFEATGARLEPPGASASWAGVVLMRVSGLACQLLEWFNSILEKAETDEAELIDAGRAGREKSKLTRERGLLEIVGASEELPNANPNPTGVFVPFRRELVSQRSGPMCGPRDESILISPDAQSCNGKYSVQVFVRSLDLAIAKWCPDPCHVSMLQQVGQGHHGRMCHVDSKWSLGWLERREAHEPEARQSEVTECRFDAKKLQTSLSRGFGDRGEFDKPVGRVRRV
jgi:hypothetical protein